MFQNGLPRLWAYLWNRLNPFTKLNLPGNNYGGFFYAINLGFRALLFDK